jgi:hypothetical protein
VNHRESPTVRAKREPLLLLVGLTPAFARRCEKSASRLGAKVASHVGAESSFMMQSLPSAVLIHDRLLATSPVAEVARQVGIELRTVGTEEIHDADLDALVSEALRAASDSSRRPRA